MIKNGQILPTVSSCAEDDFYFEPLLPQVLAHFNNLMEVYQAK